MLEVTMSVRPSPSIIISVGSVGSVGVHALLSVVSGIGMIVFGAIGFSSPAQAWLAETFNLTTVSSTVELVTGVLSLLIWVAYRPRSTR